MGRPDEVVVVQDLLLKFLGQIDILHEPHCIVDLSIMFALVLLVRIDNSADTEDEKEHAGFSFEHHWIAQETHLPTTYANSMVPIITTMVVYAC
jgi:hypothetical protein